MSLVCGDSLESLDKLMIEPLNLAIRLWVTWRGAAVLDLVSGEEGFELAPFELLAIVCEDLCRLAALVDNVFEEVNRCGPRSLWIRSGIGLRGRKVDSRYEVPVPSRCLDQRTDPIDPPGGERAPLLVRVYRRDVLCRRCWRGLVELARDAGVEFFASIPPDVCRNDVAVCYSIQSRLLPIVTQILVNCFDDL